MPIQLTGSLPGLINENTPLWDWMGQLRLNMDPSLIRYVDLVGTGGDYFDATLNRATGMIAIMPIAQADYEAFTANGLSPTLSFSVRFFMADGTVQQSQNSYSVTVLNLDDTAPQSLAFSSGGKVEVGKAGAVIGTLAVTDPDTASDFTYTVREDDQWVFEVVNGTLKLRSGVSLGLGDGPHRQVVVEVSDGRQSSAFTLDIDVTAPSATGDKPVDVLESYETQSRFHWSGNVVVGDWMVHQLNAVRDYGDLISVQLDDGASVLMQQPLRIDLLDGYLTFDGSGYEGRVWTIFETALDREPSNWEMWSTIYRLAFGTPQRQIMGELLGSAEFQQKFGALNHLDLAERLYINSTGKTNPDGAAYHAARLDRGMGVDQVGSDFVDWRFALGDPQGRATDGGLFVPHIFVQQLDIVTRVGLGMDAHAAYSIWADQIFWTQSWTLGGFINAVTQTPQYQAKMGWRDNASFAQEFYTEALGMPPDPAWVSLAAGLLNQGSLTRNGLIEVLALTADTQHSYVYQLPDGKAFENPW